MQSKGEAPREFEAVKLSKEIEEKGALIGLVSDDRTPEEIYLAGAAAQKAESEKWCKCGGVVLADTEDWPSPLCNSCYELAQAHFKQDSEKEIARLREALEHIAKQIISEEELNYHDSYGYEDTDFQHVYELTIKDARKTLEALAEPNEEQG